MLAGIALSQSGHGWTLFSSDVADTVLTVLWVVGVVNAFNLMDNLDGATATLAGVSAAGIGAPEPGKWRHHARGPSVLDQRRVLRLSSAQPRPARAHLSRGWR